MSFLTREVMENATNYTEAWQALSTPRLLAPVYFILGGTQPYEVRNVHIHMTLISMTFLFDSIQSNKCIIESINE